MSLTDRTIAAALTLGLAAVAPAPPADSPKYRWGVAQDAGTHDASAAGGSDQPAPTAAEIERALRAYQQAAERRRELSQ